MDRELIEYLDRRFDQTDERIEEARTESRTLFEKASAENRQTRVLVEDLRGQIQTENRQTRVLVEDLRSQIQLVAEGVTGQQQQLDRFREEVAAEFRETRALIRLSYSELDQRMQGLEVRVASLDERLTALENAA